MAKVVKAPEVGVETVEEALLVIEAKNAEIVDLKEQLAKSNTEVAKITNEVPGVFKKDGKVYKFKKGHLKFNLKGTIHDSVEALKDTELMSELIEIGAGFIEEVLTSK